MKILTSFAELQQLKTNIVYALGTFDGLHRGHQSVIQRAVAEAKAVKACTVVVTFDNHPLHILNPERCPTMLLQPVLKGEILKSLGVDYALRLPMTKDLLAMPAEAFISALTEYNDVKAFVVGQNFTFGAGGKGTPDLIQQLLAAKGIVVHALSLAQCQEMKEHVSSTLIREAVREGDLSLTYTLLGRPYMFRGTVIEGDRRGRTLGFPTLNFLFPKELTLPPDGVYVNRVLLDGQWYEGVGNLGDNPTFENQYHRFEVHLFGFDKMVYGHEATVEFWQLLRPEQRFNSLEDLIKQMKVDEQRAKDFFEKN
ncbi:riboflavin biosynthesis protein RibF [Veillonella criceti]|uniref:Riboflavin biosynthesis protein n=1 Tax=Veillonella criceti TaxID=103891 RepID=A0A380NID9_9FIRM|nr:riboflavin biosynthesis protein RibF [Veillonella criceti]SUP40448.1 Riboflavin biosynthesis protein ribF [Veillonella criceti]